VEEHFEADSLVRAARRQFAQESKVLAAYRRALGERSREQLDGRRRAGAKVGDHVRWEVPVAGDLVDDPGGDLLTDLDVPAGQRPTDAANRLAVIGRNRDRLGAL